MKSLIAIVQYFVQYFGGMVLLLCFMVTGNFNYLYAVNGIAVIYCLLFSVGALFAWTKHEEEVKQVVGPIKETASEIFRGWRLILFTTFHVGSIMFFIKNDLYKSAILMTISYVIFWIMVGKVFSIMKVKL